MSKKADKQSRDLKKQSAEIKTLRRELQKADESRAEWKARAKRSAAKAAKSDKLIKKLREELRSLTTASEATLSSATSRTASALPDESWTVTRLRASAREASLPRYSRMTKTELVEALTRPTPVGPAGADDPARKPPVSADPLE